MQRYGDTGELDAGLLSLSVLLVNCRSADFNFLRGCM